jgi:hypothetical protein
MSKPEDAKTAAVAPAAPAATSAPAPAESQKPAQAPPETPPEAPTLPELKYIETVYGDMVDPLTGLTYSRKSQELLKRTGWVDAQIAAGKMKMVK